MKRFLLLLAACLVLAVPCAPAATYKLIHAFTGGKTDGSTPTIESSLTPSGPDFYGVTLDGGQFTNGVVFQIGTNGGAIKLLHAFNGWSVLNQRGSKTDGAYPVGTPVLAGSTLFGMTESGGSNGPGFGLGTVYSVNTNGTGFQVLHHFGAQNDGYFPQGSLIIFGSTLFGMTSEGGTNATDSPGRSANFQGKYPVTISVGNNSSAIANHGSGSVTVDAEGNVTFAGILPDGTSVSQAGIISADGYWPLYVPLYDGRGSLWIWSQFTNGTIHSLPTSASWITGTNNIVPVSVQN